MVSFGSRYGQSLFLCLSYYDLEQGLLLKSYLMPLWPLWIKGGMDVICLFVLTIMSTHKLNSEPFIHVCKRCPKAYHRKMLTKGIDANNIPQMAWEGFLINRILIYCFDHKIYCKTLTSKRDHLLFPEYVNRDKESNVMSDRRSKVYGILTDEVKVKEQPKTGDFINRNEKYLAWMFTKLNVICSLCDTEQEVQQVCRNCGVCMGRYFCGICKLFDDDTSKHQYHCDGCGICRIRGSNNFFHCNKCGCCYSILLKSTHPCVERAMHQDCPVCFETGQAEFIALEKALKAAMTPAGTARETDFGREVPLFEVEATVVETEFEKLYSYLFDIEHEGLPVEETDRPISVPKRICLCFLFMLSFF